MVTWGEGEILEIGKARFLVDVFLTELDSTFDGFLIFKHRWMVEKYIALLESFSAKRICLLGILHGGCCVMFHKLATPEKLIAIDINPEPVAALENYIDNGNLRRVLKPYYGIDQSNSSKLREICSRELSGEPLDLVVDDASHFLEETRSSFNTLFPLLRPGGLYVIEDWSWAHASPEEPQESDGFWPERSPLTILVFELLLACGSMSGLIDEIVLNENSIWITRGNLKLNPAAFNISKQYLPRGRQLIAGLGET